MSTAVRNAPDSTFGEESPGLNQVSADAAESPHPHQTKVDDEWLISCRCESARAISTLLSCLSHVVTTDKRRRTATSSLQPVTVFCSPSSLTFHCHGKTKQMQASVDIQAGLFSEYRLLEPSDGEETREDWQAGGEFSVNLTTVLECLHVLGTQSLEKTKLYFTYNLSKEIFKMELLEESGILSAAAIPGMVPPDDEDLGNSLALAFRSSPIVARMIIRSEALEEVVHELELVSGAVTATVAMGEEGLEIAVVGHLTEGLVSIPAKGNHIVSIEVPRQETPSQNYPLHSLLGSMRGLEIAEETCVTMNSAGMMAIQHQVLEKQVGNGTPNFVDFIMCCLEDEEDQEEEQEASASQHRQRDSSSHQSAAESSGWTQRSVTTGLDSADNAEEDENEDPGRAAAEARLFGSVVGPSSHSSPTGSVGSRSVRRRTRRPKSRSRSSRVVDEDDDDASQGSRNLLLDDDEDDDDYLEAETEPLDVTAPASPPTYRSNREEQTSSPELVYGRQG